MKTARPATRRPADLASRIEREARKARRRSARRPADDVGALIAEALERLTQLVEWTEATTAREHWDRLEVWEDTLRRRHYDEGYAAAEARAAEIRTFGPLGAPRPTGDLTTSFYHPDAHPSDD